MEGLCASYPVNSWLVGNTQIDSRVLFAQEHDDVYVSVEHDR